MSIGLANSTSIGFPTESSLKKLVRQSKRVLGEHRHLRKVDCARIDDGIYTIVTSADSCYLQIHEPMSDMVQTEELSNSEFYFEIQKCRQSNHVDIQLL